MGTSTTPIPSTLSPSQDQIGEDIDGREGGSGSGEEAEEEEFSGSGSETQNLRPTTDSTLANPKLVDGDEGGLVRKNQKGKMSSLNQPQRLRTFSPPQALLSQPQNWLTQTKMPSHIWPLTMMLVLRTSIWMMAR